MGGHEAIPMTKPYRPPLTQADIEDLESKDPYFRDSPFTWYPGNSYFEEEHTARRRALLRELLPHVIAVAAACVAAFALGMLSVRGMR